MFKIFDNTETIKSARSTGRGKNMWLEILIAVGLMLGTTVFSTIVLGIILAVPTILNGGELDMTLMTLGTLYITVLTSVVLLLYTRFVERRPLRSIGFTKKNVVKSYVLGLLVGFIMFSAIMGIGLLTGAFKFIGIESNIQYIVIILAFIGFVLQGMEEEILCRGWLMTTISRKTAVIAGVIANSIFFAFMHIFNDGIGILPLVNLALFGLFASLYMLKTDNIWGVSAIHTIWNFVQGSFYGMSVSGSISLPTILKFEMTDKTLLNGGAFGPEGGLITTAVLVVGIAILLLLKKKAKSEEPAPQN